jgi:adenylate kinase
VESGALLREFSKGDNFTQKKIKEIIENGILVPEAEIIALWVNYLANNFTGKELLMFDGCPRKLKEAQQLSEILDFYDISEIVLIQINVSRQWATDRMLARGRKDDSVGGISHRMEYFDKEVVPVIEYFKGLKNCKFVDVNGEQPIEEVQNELLAKLGLNL